MSTSAPHGSQSTTQLPALANIRMRVGRVVSAVMKPSRSVISVSPDISKLIDLMKFSVGAYVAIRYGIQL